MKQITLSEQDASRKEYCFLERYSASGRKVKRTTIKHTAGQVSAFSVYERS